MSFQDLRISSMFRPTNNRTISANQHEVSTPSTMSQSYALSTSTNSTHNYQRDDINVGRKNISNNGQRYSTHLVLDVPQSNFLPVDNPSYDMSNNDSYDSSYDTLEPTGFAPESLIKPVIRPRNTNTTNIISKKSDYLGKKQKAKLVVKDNKKNILNSFSNVSAEILQFQQMVSSLGQQIYGLGNAPAELWKCRLQIDTMNEISKRIETQLITHEQKITTKGAQTGAADVRSALTKLTRDLKHVQTSFKNLKLEFGQRQKMNDLRLMQEEMIKKSFTEDSAADRDARIMLQMKEEEYAHQVMRERESEIVNINQKMHQVTDIYNDLGQIVNGHQEQIDVIEDTMYAARDNANYGLEQLQKANGKTNSNSHLNYDDNDDSEDEFTQITDMESSPRSSSQTEEICQFPDMETIKEYYRDGKIGIMEFMEYGTNVMEIGIDKALEAKTNIMQCVSTNVTNYRHRHRKK